MAGDLIFFLEPFFYVFHLLDLIAWSGHGWFQSSIVWVFLFEISFGRWDGVHVLLVVVVVYDS